MLAAFEESEEGEKHIITRYRSTNTNLRTQLHRIIQRAGLEPWPKTFQNLRSTRETELAEAFPMHVVCKWVGNSEPIAAAHYLQLTDEHFYRAIGEGATMAQNAAKKLHERTGNGTKRNVGDDEGTAGDARDCEAFPVCSGYFTEGKMTGLGLEPRTSGLKGLPDTSPNQLKTSINECGRKASANHLQLNNNHTGDCSATPKSPISLQNDPQLARVVHRWSRLSPAQRSAVVAVVEASIPGKRTDTRTKPEKPGGGS